jgi:DNA adenine methylase
VVGSVLLTLLCFIREQCIKVNESIYAYDLNEPLIYMYKNIQTQHEELFEEKDTSFVKYTINGFNIEDHNDLFQMIHNLTNQNKKL